MNRTLKHLTRPRVSAVRKSSRLKLFPFDTASPVRSYFVLLVNISLLEAETLAQTTQKKHPNCVIRVSKIIASLRVVQISGYIFSKGD